MSLNTMRAWTEGTLQNALTAQYPAVPCRFLNAPFTQPAGMWAALHIIEGSARQAELGPQGIERHIGILQIDVFVPENTGSGDLITMTEWTGSLYRRKDIRLPDGAYLRFKDPSIKTFYPAQALCRACMSIAYWRDERVPVVAL